MTGQVTLPGVVDDAGEPIVIGIAFLARLIERDADLRWAWRILAHNRCSDELRARALARLEAAIRQHAPMEAAVSA